MKLFFFYNIKKCEQQLKDIEKVIDEISKISKENYKIFDEKPEIIKKSAPIPMHPPPPCPTPSPPSDELIYENINPMPSPPSPLQFNISNTSSGETIYERISVLPTESTGAIPKHGPLLKMRKSTRFYKELNKLDEDEAAKLNVIEAVQLHVIEKVAAARDEKVAVAEDEKVAAATEAAARDDEKVAAASKLGGIKETEKFDAIEMDKIVNEPEPKIDAQSEQWEDVKLIENTDDTPENTDNKPENTLFLYKMRKNGRFKNLFKKCSRCKKKICNCKGE